LLISYQNENDFTVTISRFIQITGIINRTLKTSQVQKHTRLKMYNILGLPASLYGYRTWAIREQYKSSVTSVQIQFMRRTAKYTWQDYKTNEGILSELKINPVMKKIKNYGNKLVQHFRRMEKDRPPHSNMKYQPCGKRSKERPLKRLLECEWDRSRSQGLNPSKLYDEDDDEVRGSVSGVEDFQLLKFNVA